MKKRYDTVVVGGGIIGASLAFELRRRGQSVLVLDRQEPGREASWRRPVQFRPRRTTNPSVSPHLDVRATVSIRNLRLRLKKLQENPLASIPTARWNYFWMKTVEQREIAG